jgi:RND family efflux transporter MFP subunit
MIDFCKALTPGLLAVCWVVTLSFSACTEASNPETAIDEVTPTATIDKTTGTDPTIATVSIVSATLKSLPLRRRTNGLIRARRQITVKTFAGGELLTAPQEGDYLEKNTALLTIDPRDAQIALARATAARNEADYRHRELLLRMRNAAGTDTLSAIQSESMLQQSGLPATEVAVEEAELQLERLTVKAPFAGRVADAKVQAGDLVNLGEEVCTLIDLTSLEAEFSLLEQELGTVKANSRCFVSPASGNTTVRIPALIDILNPKVEEGGLLRARARLGRIPRGVTLYPGLNVYVTIEEAAPAAVVIPKQAVVIRSGREVVFVYDPDSGRTEWRYVTIAHENDESVAISEGVEAGESVIISGNLTLDHDIPVYVE